jgi:hypothetical protein
VQTVNDSNLIYRIQRQTNLLCPGEVDVPEAPILAAAEPKIAGLQLLGGNRKTAAGGAAIVVLLFGLGALGFGGYETVTKGDKVSSTQAAKLAEAFGRARGSLLPVDVSTERHRAELIRALPMPRMEAERLMDQVERGERMLGWLTLWDNFDEDGDVVSVTAVGMIQSVPLLHAPKRILVPYVPGRPVLIIGERDGMGGGVTVAVELSTGPLPLPPLAVGQTVALPLQ